VRIQLNGAPRELDDGATVADVVLLLGRDPEARGIAVAVEAEVVPRTAWDRHELRDGDRIEVLTAILGG
jgi:sulfur carrier protein